MLTWASLLVNLIVGLTGAAIGALGAIAVAWINARTERLRIQTDAQKERERVARQAEDDALARRRQFLSMAMEAAIADHKAYTDFSRISGKTAALYPLSIFMLFNDCLLQLVESGTLTPESLKGLHIEVNRLNSEAEIWKLDPIRPET